IDLGHQAVPHSSRKCVDRKSTDTEPRPGINRCTHRFDSCPMTGDARLPALCYPTSIAAHDDRDMAWQTSPINRRQEHRFAGSFFYYLVEVGNHSVFLAAAARQIHRISASAPL